MGGLGLAAGSKEEQARDKATSKESDLQGKGALHIRVSYGVWVGPQWARCAAQEYHKPRIEYDQLLGVAEA